MRVFFLVWKVLDKLSNFFIIFAALKKSDLTAGDNIKVRK